MSNRERVAIAPNFFENLSAPLGMAIYTSNTDPASIRDTCCFQYNPDRKRQISQAIAQGHNFYTLPEKRHGFRGVLTVTQFRDPSDQLSDYQRESLNKELAKIIAKYKRERLDGIVIEMACESLSNTLMKWIHDLHESGISIAISNQNLAFSCPNDLPILGVARSIDDAAKFLKISKIENHPQNIRSIALLERSADKSGLKYLEIQSWFPQDTTDTALMGLVEDELQRVLPHIAKTPTVVMLDGTKISSRLIEMLKDQLGRFCIVNVVFAPYAVSFCEDSLAMKTFVHQRRSAVSATIQKELCKPRLEPPPDGFISFKPPLWDRSHNGFFRVEPNLGVDLTNPASGLTRRFMEELHYIAAEGKHNLLMVLNEMSVDPEIALHIRSEVHHRLEKRGNLLVVLQSGCHQGKIVGVEQGLVVCSDIDSAYNKFDRHFCVEPPFRRWKYFKRPEKIIEDDSIVFTSLSDISHKKDGLKAYWSKVAQEYRSIIYGDCSKLLIDISNCSSSQRLIEELQKYGEFADRKFKSLGVIQGDKNSRLHLKLATSSKYFKIHKNLDEALLHHINGLEAPYAGWETFNLERLSSGRWDDVVVKITFSYDSYKAIIDGRIIISDINGEFIALVQSGYDLIIDIPNSIAGLMDESTIRSLKEAYKRIKKYGNVMVLVSENPYIANMIGFEPRHAFLNLNDAYNWLQNYYV